MTDFNWSEALKGWEVKLSDDGPGARWFVSKPSGYCNVVTCREVDNHVVSDLLDSMARASVATPKESSTWTGDGLPPVGTVCEVMDYESDWHRCEIIAHHNDRAVFPTPAYYPSTARYDGHEMERFRPIRTPEQIAEEERNAAIVEIGRLFHEGGPAAIYFAGYRKQEAV